MELAYAGVDVAFEYNALRGQFSEVSTSSASARSGITAFTSGRTCSRSTTGRCCCTDSRNCTGLVSSYRAGKVISRGGSTSQNGSSDSERRDIVLAMARRRRQSRSDRMRENVGAFAASGKRASATTRTRSCSRIVAIRRENGRSR